MPAKSFTLFCVAVLWSFLIMVSDANANANANDCWENPSSSCFKQLWQKEAIEFVEGGERLTRLFDLISSGLEPPEKEAAKALLGNITYDDMKALAEKTYKEEKERAAASDRQPDPFEQAFQALERLAMPKEAKRDPLAHLKDPDPYYVNGIYRLVVQTGDQDLMRKWYEDIPAKVKVAHYLQAPSGTAEKDIVPIPNEAFYDEAAKTIQVMQYLSEERIDQAFLLAEKVSGEARFMAFKEIANRAIHIDDMSALKRSITGMASAFNQNVDDSLNDETFELAVKAAEEEFERTGDPDALAAVYETADGIEELGDRAWIAIYLADFLVRERGADSVYPAAALETYIKSLSSDEIEESYQSALMRNALVAWQLGYTKEARMLVDRAFDSLSGLPDFQLHNLSKKPTDWSTTWLDEMKERFEYIKDNPVSYKNREYWDIWVDQDAYSHAYDITKTLSAYGRKEEARVFAEDAAVYLIQLTKDYPDEIQSPETFEGFLTEVGPWIYTSEKVIAMRHARPTRHHNGERDYGIAQDLAEAGQIKAALKLISETDSVLNAKYWMQLTNSFPEPERADYLKWLEGIIGKERTRLESKYPTLADSLMLDASLFWAMQGRWQKAKQYFEEFEGKPVGENWRQSSLYLRIKFYKAIIKFLEPETEEGFGYPYENYALELQ